jgi:hypothetical protein
LNVFHSAASTTMVRKNYTIWKPSTTCIIVSHPHRCGTSSSSTTTLGTHHSSFEKKRAAEGGDYWKIASADIGSGDDDVSDDGGDSDAMNIEEDVKGSWVCHVERLEGIDEVGDEISDVEDGTRA